MKITVPKKFISELPLLKRHELRTNDFLKNPENYYQFAIDFARDISFEGVDTTNKSKEDIIQIFTTYFSKNPNIALYLLTLGGQAFFAPIQALIRTYFVEPNPESYDANFATPQDRIRFVWKKNQNGQLVCHYALKFGSNATDKHSEKILKVSGTVSITPFENSAYFTYESLVIKSRKTNAVRVSCKPIDYNNPKPWESYSLVYMENIRLRSSASDYLQLFKRESEDRNDYTAVQNTLIECEDTHEKQQISKMYDSNYIFRLASLALQHPTPNIMSDVIARLRSHESFDTGYYLTNMGLELYFRDWALCPKNNTSLVWWIIFDGNQGFLFERLFKALTPQEHQRMHLDEPYLEQEANDGGATPFLLCAIKGLWKTLEFFINNIKINSNAYVLRKKNDVGFYGKTALHFALEAKQWDLAKRLMGMMSVDNVYIGPIDNQYENSLAYQLLKDNQQDILNFLMSNHADAGQDTDSVAQYEGKLSLTSAIAQARCFSPLTPLLERGATPKLSWFPEIEKKYHQPMEALLSKMAEKKHNTLLEKLLLFGQEEIKLLFSLEKIEEQLIYLSIFTNEREIYTDLSQNTSFVSPELKNLKPLQQNIHQIKILGFADLYDLPQIREAFLARNPGYQKAKTSYFFRPVTPCALVTTSSSSSCSHTSTG